MKELQKIFEDLPSRYKKYLSNVEKEKAMYLYSAYDFFSLEPFHCERTNMPLDKLKFETSLEALEEQDQYLCMLKDRKLIFSRLFCGGETYYDSFYKTEENLSWRYEIYSNPNIKKAVHVEYLEKLDSGAPKCFKKFGMYGGEQHDFVYVSEVEIHITIHYFDSKCNASYSEQRKVYLKADQSGVDKIVSVVEGVDVEVFDANLAQESIDSLLEKCKQSIFEVIKEGIISNPPKEKDICLSLMEYNMQFPFPPTFAMATVQEKESILEEYDGGSLSWINAPDLRLFSEDGVFSIDFNKDDALYSRTNALIEDLPFEEVEPKVIDVYVEISKALKNDEMFNESINQTKDYFVLARDYNACNEEMFMEKTLPRKVWAEWEKEINEREQKEQSAFDQDEEIIEVKRIIQEQLDRYPHILEQNQKREGKNFYSISQEYYSEPFYKELTKHKPSYGWMERLQTDVPDAKSYFHYKIKDRKPYMIKEFYDGSLLRIDFLEHHKNTLYHHNFHVKEKPSLEEYSIIQYRNGLPVECLKYSDLRFESINYLVEEDKIVRANVSHTMYFSRYKDETKHDYEYMYKDENLYRIDMINMGNRSVRFCVDDSYMYEVIDNMVALLSKLIVPVIGKENLASLKGIVLEYEDRMTFPPKVYLVQQDDFTEVDIPNIWNSDVDDVMTNFKVYTFIGHTSEGLRFEPESCLQFVNLAYKKLCKAINSLLKEENAIDIKVVYKEQYQPTEEVLKELS